MAKKTIVENETEQAERERLSNMYTTALKKAKFVYELKGGLGNEIKAIGGRPKIIKKTWLQKFINQLKKIFTKF